MTSAQVVETSVTNNSSFQNYPHPDDHTIRTTDTPGFKPFTILVLVSSANILGAASRRQLGRSLRGEKLNYKSVAKEIPKPPFLAPEVQRASKFTVFV